MKKISNRSLWVIIACFLLLTTLIPLIFLLPFSKEKPPAKSSISWPKAGETALINSKQYTYLGDADANFNPCFIKIDEENYNSAFAGTLGDGYYLWDGNKTLTLCGITTEYFNHTAIHSDFCIDIVLVGDNVLCHNDKNIPTQPTSEEWADEDYYDDYSPFYYGLNLYAGTKTGLNSTTIKGDGTLKIECATDGEFHSIQSEADLIFENAIIDLNSKKSDNSDAYGIQCERSITLKEAMIKNAKLNAKEDITLNHSTLRSTTLHSEKKLSILNDSSVTLSIPNSPDKMVPNVIHGEWLLIQDSTLSAKIKSTVQGTSHYPEPFIIGRESFIIDNSTVNVSVDLHKRTPCALYSYATLDIRNHSDVQLWVNGTQKHYGYPIVANCLKVRDSHLHAETPNGHAVAVHKLERWEENEYVKRLGKIDILEEDLITPATYNRITVLYDDRPYDKLKYYSLADAEGNSNILEVGSAR